MRKASTLVGLTLFALASTARAEEAASAASAAPPTAPPASEAATAPAAPPAEDATASSANQSADVSASAAQPATGERKLSLALSLLPMAAGRVRFAPSGVAEDYDAMFAYGLGLSLDYLVYRGLSVGLAPQGIFNVKAKTDGATTAKQLDLMVRLAYAHPVADNIRLYAEVLPGYSILITDDMAKGLVVAFGAGASMDLGDRVFANVGAGYEIGFQKFRGDSHRTKFVRVALAAGVRF